ncbi:MAG: DAK2 domain-containing protein [Oscillospiraceae bacterium]|nr:DAK2 domain-containing protein [Oscillospiraceae bacterium]
MTEKVTGAAFREMILNGAAAIQNHREEINELNVFPVPDGDTGTNMSLTMGAGADALAAAAPGTVSRAADVAAGAFLRGARGNSGVILSLLFRGAAKRLKELDAADARTFAAALQSGVETAYGAVMKPAEGTILTVSRLAADAAVAAAEEETDVEAVLASALAAGQEALADTINQNPVLKKAGVIDAGGKGYLYILDGMRRALQGERIELERAAAAADKADFTSFETEDIRFTYCTEFIIARKTKRDVNQLRDFLDARGDSIVVVEDDEIIKVHVHSNEPGNVLTEALTYGPLLTVKVENMKEQHTSKVVEAGEQDDVPAAAEPEKKYGVVAVCAGDGLTAVFGELGADGVITGGQTMNPSTEDILRKVEAAPAEIVYVLPNNGNIIMAAQQAVPLASKKVVVIPTKTVPQGVSALMALDPDGEEEANTRAMTEAAAGVHTVQITYAARDSLFSGLPIRAGEYLALLENSLLATGPELSEIITAVKNALAPFDPEFLTVFYGENVPEEDAEAVAEELGAVMPDAELSVINGGQPVYYYMISAE